MSGKNQKKIPKAFVHPKETKMPKAQSFPTESCRPEFKADQMDLQGPWGWDHLGSKELQEIFSKIFDTQKLTWQELKGKGSHLVDVKDLIPEAQKRLIEIQKEDTDQLYSLRLSGVRRIWGIKDSNIFWILWWDPSHKVCKSNKKHT